MNTVLPFFAFVFTWWAAGCLVPAVLAVPMARGRGRDAAAWFMLVLLSGWLGFFVLLMSGSVAVRTYKWRRTAPRKFRGSHENHGHNHAGTWHRRTSR